MPKTQKILQSFNAGELSPKLDARIDQNKYDAGCQTLENFIPMIYGGAERRPGQKFIAKLDVMTAKGRVVAFEHSVNDVYVLLFENQQLRFFKDGAQVFTPFGTEDLSSIGSIVAHWLMDDNAASTTVLDNDGATHNGASVTNTSTLTTTDAAGVANEALDLDGADFITVSDSPDFSFGDATNDSAFSIAAWVDFESTGVEQVIMSKYDEVGTDREWLFRVTAADLLSVELYDESLDVSQGITAVNALSPGWHFVVATYNGAGGVDAVTGLSLYIDGSILTKFEFTKQEDTSYIAMEAGASDVIIGAETSPQVLISQAAGTAAGDMSGGGGLAASFDSDDTKTAAEASVGVAPGAGGPSVIGKDWGASVTRKVTGFKITSSSDQGFVNTDNPTVTVTLQGSANGSDWTDLGSAADTDANGKVITALSGMTTTVAYRHHRLKITHDSGNDRDIYSAEAEFYETNNAWAGKVDNVAVFSKELSALEVASLVGDDSTTPYEIVTPYLTADLPTLKFEHSADVMFITHPSYEERRLSRFGDTAWSLVPLGLQTGPFRDLNEDTAQTITPSAATGTGITLTAIGHSPFVEGTTAGHSPSGSSDTSKSVTGALFKLIHGLETVQVDETLDMTDNPPTEVTTALDVFKDASWNLTTGATWTGVMQLQRSYDGGTTFEVVEEYSGITARNFIDSGTEEFADAKYRVKQITVGTGTTAEIYLRTDDIDHIGIVQITSVTSPQVAVGNVVRTLGGTTATHRFAEGSFSNFRGFPAAVAISPEERLTFAGNAAEPLNLWGSAVGDFTDYSSGVLDDDPITSTLVGTGKQNQIQWLVAQDALTLGTVGGEHVFGGSNTEEPVTPTNRKGKIKTTHGSENIQALLAGRAVLFAERGGKRIRELIEAETVSAGNLEANDLTVFSEQILGGGIVDMSFQRTPDPALWCVRSDGDMAVMTYERKQDVFSWYRIVSGASADFESVAIVYGGANSEDEIWVTVKRILSNIGIVDLSDFDNIVAHWLLNDNLATTAVLDDDGNTHDATATSNTSTLNAVGRPTDNCFDFGGTDAVELASDSDFQFGDGTDDSAFSVTAWGFVTSGLSKTLVSKWSRNSKREWVFQVTSIDTLRFSLADQSESAFPQAESDDAITDGWHHFAATYPGQTTEGATAGSLIKLYVDGVEVAATATEDASYVAMEALAANVAIGAFYNESDVLINFWQDKIDSVAIFSDVLTATEVAALAINKTVRYVERFAARDLPADVDDMTFVDSHVTYDSTAATSITGLGTLEGETVSILADGLVITDQEVISGAITLSTAASTVQVGLGYTSILKPMKLNIADLSIGVTMKVNRMVGNFFETINGKAGPTLAKNSNLNLGSGTTLFTGIKELSLKGGYSRTGDIIVQQAEPLPMTVLALALDVGVSND